MRDVLIPSVLYYLSMCVYVRTCMGMVYVYVYMYLYAWLLTLLSLHTSSMARLTASFDMPWKLY